jgi:hypothetical protein
MPANHTGLLQDGGGGGGGEKAHGVSDTRRCQWGMGGGVPSDVQPARTVHAYVPARDTRGVTCVRMRARNGCSCRTRSRRCVYGLDGVGGGFDLGKSAKRKKTNMNVRERVQCRGGVHNR